MPHPLTEGQLSVQTISRLSSLRTAITDLREAGGTVALVPTMGALHEGHMSLVRLASKRADHVVASIFVNPRQFGEGEDLDAYPRQLARDAALLKEAGVAVLWAPDADAMYPPGYATNVSVSGVADELCGADRPGHFDGVATVVCKLFNQVRPDMAVFGEKDWQQLAVIRRMARDLDLAFPHVDAIIGAPIMREADGFAMSSRNAYLSPEQREVASTLPRAMRQAIETMQQTGECDPALRQLRDALTSAGFGSVDYAELRDGNSLALLDTPTTGARLFVAARIGSTRLIDNMDMSPA